MTAIPVVILLIAFQVALKIFLAPKQPAIEELASYGPDQSLDESMRTRRAGNGLDLVDFEYPQVRSPAMKTEQRIVVRGEMPGQSLPRDRPIEHLADSDAVEIGLRDSEADDPTGVYIHHHHDPVAAEQD